MTPIMDYMLEKGLMSKEMRGHGKRTITSEKVAMIKQSISGGNTSVTNLCAIHKVSAPTIRKVKNGGYDGCGKCKL